MEATQAMSELIGKRSSQESFTESLHCLEILLDQNADGAAEAGCCESVKKELRKLHARFRAHDAAGLLAGADAGSVIPPEFTNEAQRLRGEHPQIMGQLDWLVRNVDSIADRSAEDKEVFVLRVRELIAVLRRHEAEEDRLFFLALWRETGGEGG